MPEKLKTDKNYRVLLLAILACIVIESKGVHRIVKEVGMLIADCVSRQISLKETIGVEF